jgi:hypothetical protein
MGGNSSEEKYATIGTALGAIMAVVFSGLQPMIWYLPVSAILVAILMPYWKTSGSDRMGRAVYAAVFALALMPAIAWLLSPLLPVVIDRPRVTWWRIGAADLELFVLWVLVGLGIYHARR